MEKIKINFCCFWGSFKKEDNIFVRLLRKHFDVEISDKPDYIFVSNRGKPFEYMKYNCTRIMFMGENLSPDFTVFDYVVGFDNIIFGDRYFRFPLAFLSDDFTPWDPEQLTEEKANHIFEQKEYFCNFIYRHPSSNGMRERLFYELSKYKECISPGTYLNNVNNAGGVYHGRTSLNY